MEHELRKRVNMKKNDKKFHIKMFCANKISLLKIFHVIKINSLKIFKGSTLIGKKEKKHLKKTYKFVQIKNENI